MLAMDVVVWSGTPVQKSAGKRLTVVHPAHIQKGVFYLGENAAGGGGKNWAEKFALKGETIASQSLTIWCAKPDLIPSPKYIF